MRRSRPLSDDERMLWSTVTRSIAPLKGRKAPAAAIETAPVAAPSRHKAPSAPPAAPPPRTPAPLAPMDRQARQKVARGRTEIGGRLDLHGLTQAEAHGVLARFLHQ